MAQNKTQPTKVSPESFIEGVENETKRKDAYTLLEIMKDITNEVPVMWGPSLIGFGQYHYKYESGREGDFFITGFSPRKSAMTVYIMPGFKRYAELMSKLGKFKTGKSCLYINKLADIDVKVLKTLIRESVDYMNAKYNKN